METQNPFLKDEDGKEVDVYIYRSMIGSLMYLTSSRPDIMFAVVSVRSILTYTDSDYARASLDRKSTTGGCQFLGCRLISGRFSKIPTDPHHTPTFIQQSPQPQKTQKPRRPKKKDTQVPQSSVPSDNVADEAVYKELDDSLVRAATTASSLEAEQDSGNINKTQSKATLNEPSSTVTSSGSGPRCQETMGDTIAQTRSENVSKLSNDPLLARGNTLQSGEDSLKLSELMELWSRSLNRKRGQELMGEEDASKQGRIADLDANEDIYLVNIQTDEDMFGVNDLDGDEVIVESVDVVNTAEETRSVVEEVTAVIIPIREKRRRNNRISKKWEKDPYNISEKFTSGYEILLQDGMVGKTLGTSTGCLPPHQWLNSRIGIITHKHCELGRGNRSIVITELSSSLSIPVVLICHQQETSQSPHKRIINRNGVMRWRGGEFDSIRIGLKSFRGRKNSPRTHWKENRSKDKNQSKCSRFSMESTRSDSASKIQFPLELNGCFPAPHH
ncbi:hypothetical protein Tco_1561355 [Tanacetum coccineum]